MSVTGSATRPANDGNAIFRLSMVFLFTAFWLLLGGAFPELQGTGILNAVTRITIHTAILTGLWFGLARTDFNISTRRIVWLSLAIPFIVWLAVVWWLAFAGGFLPRADGRNPAIPIAILFPLIVGLPSLLLSARVTAVLDAMPTSWLVGVQVYRILGGTFLFAWSRGSLASAFALSAGSGDVLVGLLALPVAYLLHIGYPGGRKLAIAWNILGLLDFANAVLLGVLSTPGPLQIFASNLPNTQLGSFPTVMIPAFAVPSSILLHALSIRQLRRVRRRNATGAA